MNLETFLETFDKCADSPGGMAKFRELVRTLAVQGDFSVGSSGVSEWPTVTMEQVCALITDGEHATPQRVATGVPLATAKNIRDGFLDLSNTDYVTKETAEKCWRRCKPKDGDILMVCVGATTGRMCLVRHPPDMVLVRSVALLRPNTTFIDATFLDLFLRSPSGQSQIWGGVKQNAQPCLYLGKMNAFTLSLPPLAEQHRIVAKVHELMALCDRLEAQRQQRVTQHAALARASLARFAAAPTPANLEVLFHPSYTIAPDDLRTSILTFAVQGKLVPQDHNDEPAERTLRACGVDIKRWSVTKDEERRDVPQSWAWIRFAGVGEQRLGKMLDVQKNRGESKPYLRNTNVQWLRFALDDVKEMRVEEREQEELRLRHGDLLICEGGEPGRCAIWRDELPEMYFQKALHRVRPYDAILPEFLALNLQIDCQNEVLAGYYTGATIKHLTGRSLSEYPIPVPPLAEQRRIVAKVDQLMTLVDKLETQLAASSATAANLLSAIVIEFTANGHPMQGLSSPAAAANVWS
jgi:type I restriction enzyme S subunit